MYAFFFFLQIFFLVITFALYNGLVILPIILSYIGPEAEVINDLPNSNMDVKLESQAEEEKDQELEVNQKMLPEGVS